MKDSNQTLRWNRSAREAYGHDIDFSDHNPDIPVWYVTLFVLGFITGMLVFG